jgi:hypothetical protein
MEWSVTRKVVLEAYFLRENDWTKTPQFVNAAGATVQFYIGHQAAK